MRVPIIDKNYGMYGILVKINGIDPVTVGTYKQVGKKAVPIYYYERKKLKGKINHGFVEI